MKWVKACALENLSASKPYRCKVDGIDMLIVTNSENKVTAFENRCSHMDYPLHNGKWNSETQQITCALHGAIFDLTLGGKPSLGPAILPLIMYEAEVRSDGEKKSVFIKIDDED